MAMNLPGGHCNHCCRLHNDYKDEKKKCIMLFWSKYRFIQSVFFMYTKWTRPNLCVCCHIKKYGWIFENLLYISIWHAINRTCFTHLQILGKISGNIIIVLFSRFALYAMQNIFSCYFHIEFMFRKLWSWMFSILTL